MLPLAAGRTPLGVRLEIFLGLLPYGVFCSLRELLPRNVLLTFLDFRCSGYNSPRDIALGVAYKVNDMAIELRRIM